MNVIYEWKKYTRIILKTEDRYKVENFPFLCNTRNARMAQKMVAERKIQEIKILVHLTNDIF